MRRALIAAQVVGVLGSAVLFGLAAAQPSVSEPSAVVAAGAPIALGERSLAWPVTVRTDGGITDVVLAIRIRGAGRTASDAAVSVCRGTLPADAASCPADGRLAATVPLDGLGDHVAVLSGVVPRVAHRLTIEVQRPGAARSAVRLAVNATPCAVARSSERWVVRRTRSTIEPPSGRAGCGTVPLSWLPAGIIVWTATTALAVVANRARWRR